MINGFSNLPQSTWQAPVATATLLPTVGSINGDVRVTLDTDDIYIFDGSAWNLAGGGGGGGVTSINTETGAITITGTGGTTVSNIGTAFTINSSTGLTEAQVWARIMS